MSDGDKTLHIDDDWKSQAAAEKERLAEELDTAASPTEEEVRGTPFMEIINTLAMQAMVGLGVMQGPGGQAIPPNFDAAKHFIDLLDVLEQKTKGNLEPDEKTILDQTLHQLRIIYVEVVRGGAGGPAMPNSPK